MNNIIVLLKNHSLKIVKILIKIKNISSLQLSNKDNLKQWPILLYSVNRLL